MKRTWLVIVLTSSILLATNYTLVQQEARIGGDDISRAAADTARSQLAAGQTPAAAVPNFAIDMATDSSTFLIITDENRKVLASSEHLDGATSLPPEGVFEQAKSSGSNSVSWAPKSDVRAAIVVVPYQTSQGNGFIVAGHSLKHIETRTSNYLKAVAIAWVGILLSSSVILFAPRDLHKKIGGKKSTAVESKNDGSSSEY